MEDPNDLNKQRRDDSEHQGDHENPDHVREEIPGRPAVSSENMREQAEEGREQQAEEGRGDLPTRVRLFVRRLFRGR